MVGLYVALNNVIKLSVSHWRQRQTV